MMCNVMCYTNQCTDLIIINNYKCSNRPPSVTDSFSTFCREHRSWWEVFYTLNPSS